jgi:hypothetical protein
VRRAAFDPRFRLLQSPSSPRSHHSFAASIPWDFDLKWTGRGVLTAAGADGISIFDAVDRELGMKLELQKVPTPVIVVDSVNQRPTANPPGMTQTLPPAGLPLLQATCQNMTRVQFVSQLQDIAPVYIHYPAVDATGLEGAWDFTLAFNPVPPGMTNGLIGGGREGPGRAGVLVIDHLEAVPTEN